MSSIPIPFPRGFMALKAFPRLRERLLNLFFADDAVIDTPGIEEIAAGVGITRCAFELQDLFYQVSGTQLIRIDQSGETLVIGSVPGDGQLSVDTNFTHAVIVGAGTGSDGYYFDGVTLTQHVNANFIGAVHVSESNGKWLYTPPDGGPLFFSDALLPDDIDADYFFDAERNSDRNIATVVKNDLTYVLGAETIELFRDIGPLPAPFVRVTGGSIPVGLIGGLVDWGDGFAFIGREKGQGYRIWSVANGQRQEISNSAVDELLQSYTEAELIGTQGARFQWNGHDVLVFHMKQHTLCYHAGGWFFMQSGITGYTSSEPWRARWLFHWRGYYWCGDSEDGRIGRLAEIDTEYGDPIQRVLETAWRLPDRESYFTVNSLDVDLVSARGGEGRVGLAISTDGKLFGPTMWRDVPKQYGDRMSFSYPGGLGTFPSYLGIRLSLTDDAQFAADSLTVDVE